MKEKRKNNNNNNKKKNKKANKGRKEQEKDRSYSERVRANDFVAHLSLTSLIFKSKLAIILLIILKQIELYESKHVAVEYIYYATCYPF